jgi:hypothetical protein
MRARAPAGNSSSRISNVQGLTGLLVRMLPTESGAKPSWTHAMRAKAPAGNSSSSNAQG